MRKLIFGIIILSLLIVPVMAEDITAPPAPEEAQPYMPTEPQTFSEGLLYIIRKGIAAIEPELADAGKLCVSLIAVCILGVISQQFSENAKSVSNLTATILFFGYLDLWYTHIHNLGMNAMLNLSCSKVA